jgi:hypothetical protein
MPEIFRTRDVVVFHKGPSFTVEVSQSTATSGWLGGSGFVWTDPVGDRLLATVSDGLFGGFALWGSDESSDDFTASTRNQPTYRFVVLAAGGWIFSTSTYERYTYVSRTGGGPLVPLVYNASDRLRFSLRGYFTVEDEWDLSGDPRAPNLNYVGAVVQRPTPSRSDYLTIQAML